MILPNGWIENSIETYIYHHTTKSQIIYWVVLAALVLTFLALPLIYVDISVQSGGVVRPVAEKSEIRATVTEMVDKVYAREGQTIKKGDKILSFRSSAPEAKIGYQTGRLRDFSSQLSDLEYLAKGKCPAVFQSAVRLQEYNSYKEKKREMEVSLEHVCKEYERNKSLYEKAVISEEEYDRYLYEYKSKKQELASFVENQTSTWQTELNTYRNQYSEMNSDMKQEKTDMKDMYVVRSPINGTIDQFSGIYEGSSLQSGQTIAVVSPDSTVYVEAYVSPNDIGYISAGMKVKVQVASFNYNEWGTLAGIVSDVSSDYMSEEQGNPYYKVKCRMDSNYLEMKKTGIKGYLKKGMTVSVHFMITRRSVFDLLFQNINEWMNPTQYCMKQKK